MHRWHDLARRGVEPAPSAVTIGVFDGVHKGHQKVLRRTVELAAELDARAVAVTFDPNPLAVLRPEALPPALCTLDRRLELFGGLGVDDVVVLPFTAERSRQSAEDFVDELVAGVRPRVVVVGEDFRFGHRAGGDVALLHKPGERLGFRCESLRRGGSDEDLPWSSTYVRQRLAAGDVARAAAVLDRPFDLRGVVVRGDRRGRRLLGIPTANVPVDPRLAVPADGVYAGWLTRGDDPNRGRLPAAISVGTKPQFGENERVVEAHVLGRDDLELYDVPVVVEFTARIRGQEVFGSVAELVARMRADLGEAARLLRR